MIVFAPIGIGIIWYVLIRKNKIKIKKRLLIDFSWIVFNILLFLFFVVLIKVDKNIIIQNPNVVLNGLEYLVFPIWFTFVPLIILIILRIIYFIYVKIKKWVF